ncbi:MAG TPA: hypothetical protein VMY59_08910 [Candidatus Thermoplasmatota archaeon]|nr:hypothetical protein [Candidatus Thermoplasmatota archaeon]
MSNKRVPGYKIIDGHRYKLASQNISKTKAKKLAKQLRHRVRGLPRSYAQVLPMKGHYRVYFRRRKR